MVDRKQIMSTLPIPFWIDLGLLLLSLFLYYQTLDFPEMAGLFPQLVLIMILSMIALDLMVMLRLSFVGNEADKKAAIAGPIPLKQKLMVFYMAILMAVFYYFMELLGVVIGTFLFSMLSGRMMGFKKMKFLTLSSVIITVCVYLIFIVIMNSFLPEGLIFTIFRG